MTQQHYLEHMTDSQRAAVEHKDGAALVLAGPGSGKTRVITYRIVHLIEYHKVDPTRITAITFTNKAANEMKSRVDAVLPESLASAVRISTFHAMCARILRNEHEVVRLPRNYTIIDEDDAMAYVTMAIARLTNENLKEIKQWKDYRSPKSIRRYISQQKQWVLRPEDVQEKLMEAGGGSEQERFQAKAYAMYQERLFSNRSVDFDDLIMRTVLMMREHKEVKDRYALWTEQLLVDEYQDTNLSQYELVLHLSDCHGNVFVVGDHDQSIYRFRGAEPKNLNRMERDFSGKLKTYYLEDNFRSTPQIAEAANSLIEHNTQRKPKLIKAVGDSGEVVRCVEMADSKQEAAAIVEEIIGMVRAGNAKYKDFAILYRMHSKSRVFEEILVANNIPHKIIGGPGFYNREVVKDIICYLRLILNGADEVSFSRIYNKPPRGFGDVSYAQLHQLMEDRRVPIMKIFRTKMYREVLSGQRLAGAEKMRELFRQLHGMGREKVAPLIEMIIKQTDFIAYLEKFKDEKHRRRIELLNELLAAADDFDNIHGTGLGRFIEWTSLMQNNDEDTNENHVRLMTCHAAKGLEFQKLYVVSAVEDVMPIVRRVDDNGNLKTSEQLAEDIEEERRVFFVAITRAEKELTVTYPRETFSYAMKGTVRCIPSRFIKEMGDMVERQSAVNTTAGNELMWHLEKRKGNVGQKRNSGGYRSYRGKRRNRRGYR